MKWLSLASMVMLAVAGTALWAADQAPSSVAVNDQPAAAQDPSPAATSASPATNMLKGCINDMEKATTAADIMAAHQRCEVLTPVSQRLDVIYVERMAARGEPEAAFAAAQRVLAQDSRDGLARGVVAYNEAREELWPAALCDVIQANLYRPNDPLIERTAGSVLAWLDYAADPALVTAELRPKIDNLRQTAGESAGFKAAYHSAALDYRHDALRPYAGTFADDPLPPVVQVPFRVPTGPAIWQSNPARYTNLWFTFPTGLDMRKSGSAWWFPGDAVVGRTGVRSAPGFAYVWPTTGGYVPAPPAQQLPGE